MVNIEHEEEGFMILMTLFMKRLKRPFLIFFGKTLDKSMNYIYNEKTIYV